MTIINHESEAKAVLKGSIRSLSESVRAEIEEYAQNLKIIMGHTSKSFRNKKLIPYLDKCFKNGLLNSITYNFTGIQKRSRKIWLHLSLAQYTSHDLRTVHRFPVSAQVIDLWQSREVKGYDILFYVSKHALERVVLRDQVSEINSICAKLSSYASGLTKSLINKCLEFERKDFIMLGHNGIVTFTDFYDEAIDRSVPLLTTFIPLSKLSKNKLDAFERFFETCNANHSLVYFIDCKLYDDACSDKRIELENAFDANTGLVGDEYFPVLLDSLTIQNL